MREIMQRLAETAPLPSARVWLAIAILQELEAAPELSDEDRTALTMAEAALLSIARNAVRRIALSP